MENKTYTLKYCPQCKKDVIVVTKMFNTKICSLCNIIIDSPSRDKVGR